MTPERYQQLGRLFDEALELPPQERSAWLVEACRSDADLRADVEKLLVNHAESEEFLSQPALNVAAELLRQNEGSVPAERRLSHYEILSLLGAGGMGQVYLAKDVQLGRQVALKLLPSQFMQNAEYLRRFKREALAASALNHPNILTIYEFGTVTAATGDTHFLATEYVQGETLRQRFRRGQLTLPEMLDVTVQIVAALQAAHEVGIIHRDMKPDNVMIRHDGIVKVLDFGLAKLVNQVSPDNGIADQQSSITQQGAVLGTVAYMSPEQARGQAVDARTDIFSVGVMLYELLAGRQPFTGETVNHTIVAILEKDPPPLAITGRTVPAELERILQRMLAKKLDARYASAAALLTDLKQCAKQLESEAEPVAPVALNRKVSTQIIQFKTNEQLGDVTMQVSPADSALHAVNLAHVLFCDIVAYSLLPIDRQTHAMKTLQKLVRQTNDYQRADQRGELVRLPAGDGMALAFLQDVTAPVRCACDVLRALQEHPDIQLRIGIHSGPVYQSADINAHRNVVGSGVNLAQRVMDCGDAGHILLSHNVAEVLQQVSHWQPLLHDLGEHEVKHGVKVHLYNLYDEDVGNPLVPAKLGTAATAHETSSASASAAADVVPAVVTPPRRKTLWWLGALLALGLISIPVWQSFRARSVHPATQATALERSLSYFLTVQRYRNGKPYQAEFQSSGREIFASGWQFKLNVYSPQDGFLYLLNEDANGDYVLLFPLPSHNNGSAHLTAHERFQTSAYLFDERPGTEQFRLVWAAQPVPELEALRTLVNPQQQGRVSQPTQKQAVQNFIQQPSHAPLDSVRDAEDKQTTVSGRGAVLVTLLELKHR